MRAPSKRSADALLFAGVVAGVHVDHFLLEQTLHRVFDLSLVRARADAKNVFVKLFAQQRRFLGQRRGLNNFVLAHFNLSASFSSAFEVTKIFWNASNCSVFTSAAVVSLTGLTLRADLKVLSSNESETISTFSASVCFRTRSTNALVLISETANSSIVRTSPALIRSLSTFCRARRRTDLETFLE